MSFDSRAVPHKKRPAEESLSAPPAKRSSSVDQQDFRASIKHTYSLFRVLSSDESPTTELKLQAFQQLLQALAGDPPSRKLAVKLVPRFAGSFPDHFEATASSLSTLAAAGLNATDSIATQDLRLAAVEALGSIVSACCQCLDTVQQAERILCLLLWHLQARVLTNIQQPSFLSPANPAFTQEVAALQKILLGAMVIHPQSAVPGIVSAISNPDAGIAHAARALLESVVLPIALQETQHLNGSIKPHGLLSSLPADSFSALSFQQCLRASLKSAYHELSPIKGREAKLVMSQLLQRLPAASEPQSRPVPIDGLPQPDRPPASYGTISQDSLPPSNSSAHKQPSLSRPQSPDLLGASQALQPDAKPTTASPAPVLIPVDPRSSQAGVQRHFQRSPSIGRKRSRSPGPSQQQPAISLQVDDAVEPEALDFRLGGPVCRASRCLWFGSLHPSVPESELRQECMRFGNIVSITFPPCPMRDEAQVTFSNIHEAALCYEAMADMAPWGGPPLDVRFCEQLLPEGMSDAGWDEDSRQNIWVANATQSEVLLILQGASLPGPQRVLPVAGLKPGFVLNLESPSLVQPTLNALLPRFGPRSGGRRHSVSPPKPAAADPVSDFACRTLWVGQLGPDVNEKELLAAFRRYGRVTGHSMIRKSNCAFVDFESAAAATEAKQALNGARFSSCQIRLEYKDEPRGPPRAGFREPRSPSRDFGRMPQRGSMPLPSADSQSWGRPPFREGPPAHRGGFSRRDGPHVRPPSPPFRPHYRQPAPHRRSWDDGPLPASPPAQRPLVNLAPTSSLPAASPQPSVPSLQHPASGLASPVPDPVPLPCALAGRRSSVVSPPPPLPQDQPPVESLEDRDPQLPPLPPDPPSPIPRPPTEPPPPSMAHTDGTPAGPAAHQWTGAPLPAPEPVEAPPLPAPAAPAQLGPSRPASAGVPGAAQHDKPGPPAAPSDNGKANGWSRQPLPRPAEPEPDDLPKADSGLLSGLPPGFTRPRKSLSNPPAGAAPAAENHSRWTGHLAKSGKLICPILCMHPDWNASAPHSAMAIEPAEWPKQLDVDNRIDVPSVYTSFDRAHAEQRAVRKLALPPAAASASHDALLQHQQHRRAFVEFLNYLSGKRRAGVVQLRPSSQSMNGQPRILYLIPASASVIERFQLIWEPTELLVAVVVPK